MGQCSERGGAWAASAAVLALAATLPLAAAGGARSLDLESFDRVWTTIRDRHWEERPGGLDWEAVRDELRPRVERAATAGEARAATAEMIDRLGQSHFAIIPRDVYDEIGVARGEGVTGIEARWVEGRAVVVAVEPGSPADGAGVRPGWVVSRVGRERLAPRLARLDAEYSGSLQRELVLATVIGSRLRGTVGETLDVRFLDGGGRKIRRRIGLAEPPGETVRLGFLPPLRVRFEHRRLEGDVGYIAFSAFLDPGRLMPAFNRAVEQSLDARGLVLDLRGNPGGLVPMAMGMAGWLVAERERRLGTMYTRDHELRVAVLPRPRTYDGPVAVLVDGLSGSCSEVLAGGLQDLGRARVFGSRTVGAVLPSVIERLPNGDGFQYAFANYVSEAGRPLEGVGVAPDEAVAPTRDALLAGRDPVLEAALTWIRSRP